MAKFVEQVINDFSLGMNSDPRVQDTRYAQLIKNLDAHTYKHKLVPFRSSEDGDDNGNTIKIKNFCIAIRSGSGTSASPYVFNLFGLGKQSAVDRAQVYSKTLADEVGGLGDNTWTSPNEAQSSSGVANYDFFTYYKKAGLIFGARAGTNIWAFDPDSGTAWDDSSATFNYTNITQGLVHSADDILYVAYNDGTSTYVASKNGGAAWSATALTLPQHFKPTSICEYGNYLAIALSPLSNIGKSIVVLWDRNSTSWNEIIDWGEGQLTILDEVGGYLVGVNYIGTNSSTFEQKAVFKSFGGGKPVTFRELINESTFSTGDIPIAKQKVGNYLYFLLTITLNGVKEQGLWKIGKSLSGGFSVVMDRTPNNDTALTSGTLYGFYIVGDFVFIAYDSSSTHALSKTDNTSKHDVTGVYETVILNGGDSSKTKKLLGVTVMFEPLPANGEIVVKYKKDEETSFTTIFNIDGDTANELNDIRYSAINIESSGAILPTYKEITFRIETVGKTASTTGDTGVITGLKYKAEVIEDDKY